MIAAGKDFAGIPGTSSAINLAQEVLSNSWDAVTFLKGNLDGAQPDRMKYALREDETLVSDGAFAETKDFIGGLVIVECADLDEAIR